MVYGRRTRNAEKTTDIWEILGEEIAPVIAGAAAARVIPQAITPLMNAAVACDAPPGLILDRHAHPLESAGDLFGRADELDIELDRARRQIGEQHDEVSADYAAALQAQLDAAKAMREASNDDEARDAERAAREADLDRADCENALEILEDSRARVDYAAAEIKTLPQAFADAYEVPLEHIREYGPLPRSGDYLAPAGQERTA